MCFSDEPMIAIPGEFGIRLEDCVYIAEDGAHFFTKQSVAIDQPFGTRIRDEVADSSPWSTRCAARTFDTASA